MAPAKTTRLEITVLLVVNLLAEPHFNIVEDVASHRFERLNEDIHRHGADIVPVIEEWVQ